MHTDTHHADKLRTKATGFISNYVVDIANTVECDVIY